MLTFALVVGVALIAALLLGTSGAWKKVLGLAIIVYPLMWVMGALALWVGFHKSKGYFMDAGWAPNSYLLNLASIGLDLALYMLVPLLIGSFIRHNRWVFTFLFVLIFCGTNTVLYFVSVGSLKHLSNPNDGKSLYKYYQNVEKACVERFPYNMEFHPDHIGIRFSEPDDKIVQEWRQHPCQQYPPDAVAPSASMAKHEFLVSKIRFSFDACKRGGEEVVCSINVFNTDDADIDVTWKSHVSAVDSSGNSLRSSDYRVGGRWAEPSWWGLVTADKYTSALIPKVLVKVNAKFTAVSDTVVQLQNLRLNLSVPSLTWDKDLSLDFTDLPISNPPKPPEPIIPVQSFQVPQDVSKALAAVSTPEVNVLEKKEEDTLPTPPILLQTAVSEVSIPKQQSQEDERQGENWSVAARSTEPKPDVLRHPEKSLLPGETAVDSYGRCEPKTRPIVGYEPPSEHPNILVCVDYCKRTLENVACYFTMVNRSRHSFTFKVLSGEPRTQVSFIVDQLGNELRASHSIMGNDGQFDEPDRHFYMEPGSSYHGALFFPSSLTLGAANQLDIIFTSLGQKFIAKFIDVPVS